MRIILFLLAIFVMSCSYDPHSNRLEIHGYCCGDSIERSVLSPECWERDDGGLVGNLAKDTTFRLWTRYGCILNIVSHYLDSSTVDSFSRRISLLYGIDKKDLFDKDGLIDSWFWDDTISGDQIKIYHLNDSTFTMVISNPIKTQWVYDEYPIEETEYDFTSISED